MHKNSGLQLIVIGLLLCVAVSANSTTTTTSGADTSEIEYVSAITMTTERSGCSVEEVLLTYNGSATTERSLTFSWQLIPEEANDSCNVTICVKPTDVDCQYYIGNETSGTVTFDKLIPGTTYVATVNVTDNSDLVMSNSSSGTTKLVPPGSPEVISVTEETITVTWTKPNATYDGVIIDCIGLHGAKRDRVNVTRPTTNGTCNNLTAGALYNITVSTVLNNNATPPVAGDMLQNVTEPQKPDNIKVTTVSTSAINVTIEYSHNSTTRQCSNFTIRYAGNGKNTTELELNTSCSETAVTLTRLEDNSLYTVNVSTLSKSNDQVPAKESEVTSNGKDGWTLPDQVSDLQVVSKGSRWLVTNWTAVANPSNVGLYVLQISHNNRCEKQILFNVSGNVQTLPAECNRTECAHHDSNVPFNSSGYNVTDLTPYYDYKLVVTVVNPGGCGSASTPVNTTTNQDIPGVVTDPVSTPTNISLLVNWTHPKDPNGIITNYTIVWCLVDRVVDDLMMMMMLPVDFCDNDTTFDNETHYLIDGLDAYSKYNLSVAARTIIGQGDFVDISTATLTGVPDPVINVTASPAGFDAVEVSWSLLPDAYSTGPKVGYKVTATPIDNSNALTGIEYVEGFVNRSVIVQNLTAHTDYTVCVQAYAKDDEDNTYWSDPSTNCPQVKTEEAAPSAVSCLKAPEDDVCDMMNISWCPPSPRNGILQEYEIVLTHMSHTVVNETVDHEDSQEAEQSYGVNVNPNNYTYTISIRAKTGYPEYGPSYSIIASSGLCSPTTVEPSAITNPEKRTKTTFDVELERCSLCYNRNGNITFVGLIITENIGLENHIYEFKDLDALNSVFKSWSNYNETLGYRTTPDKWLETIDCNIDCLESARRYRRETVSDIFTYTVGQSGKCDGYCNHELEDSKATRRFRVRLVLGTAGGFVVMKMADDVYELKPNKAWIAAAVIVPIVIAVAVILAVLFMQRRRLGPFKERQSNTRTVQFPDGATNPAFVEEPVFERPSPVRLSEFPEYVEKRLSDSELLFSEEYKLIQEMSPRHPWTHAEMANNRAKNRFVNILPFDHSRVKLQAARDDETSDYINANYMPGYNSKREFIASQGPMKNTVEDFWRMIWEQNVPLIVMLTQLEERGRERCAKYWPSDNEPMYYGDLQVRLRSETTFDSYVTRILDMQLLDEKRTIKQMHFIRWPDFGVPDNPQMLLRFVSDVQLGLPQKRNGPILVHCSAGVGRTGSFIAIDRLLQHIRHHDTLDIFSLVLEMRNYRCYMIQVEAQYILVHKCILAALQQGLHEVPNNIYDNDDDQNIYENV